MKNSTQKTTPTPKEYALMVASGETNCTRVCSTFFGLRSYVTYRDDESKALKRFLARERARKGVVVTTTRGVWID